MAQNSSLFKGKGYNNNCVTGDEDHLYIRLKESIAKAKKLI